MYTLNTRAREHIPYLLTHLPWLILLGWLTNITWFLTDDAFISFRYARNLLEGHGLVFNPGEYVEGYSNFLWVLELAALWGLFGLQPEHAAPWLSVACTVGTIAAMLWWVAHIPVLHNQRLVAWMAMGLVCSSATFAAWTSAGGLETRQFTLFIVLGVVCLGLYRHSPWGLLAASLSLTAAAYTRPEGPLFAALSFAWFAIQYILTNRRLPWRELTILVMPFVLLVAAHYLFRYSYYGEWLPNTYYAKHVRPWYESGFRYLSAAALDTGLYLLLPLTCLTMWTRWQKYQDGTYALVLLYVVVHMAYLLRIGGDHFEYRPLDFYWPLLAVPAAAAIVQIGTVIAGRIRVGWIGGISSYQVWALLLFLPVLFYTSAIQGIWLVKDHPLLERIFQQGTEGNVQNVAPTENNNENNEESTQRLHAGIPGTPLIVPQRYRYLVPPGLLQILMISRDMHSQLDKTVALSVLAHREFTNTFLQAWKPYETMARGVIPDDALIAFKGVGIMPYYLPDLKIVDLYGLTDTTIARTPVTRPNYARKIAHDRWPAPGYLEERGVNLQIHPAAFSEAQALALANYALQVGPELWMPFDSHDHQWVVERFADRDLRTRAVPDLTDPAGNRFFLDGHVYIGEQFLARFENGLDGWRVEGEVVIRNVYDSYQNRLLTLGNSGFSFLTSFHPNLNTIGKALSPQFSARADQYLVFLFAGSGHDNIGVRLWADGEEVAVWHGQHPERFALGVYPLAAVAAKRLQLELFDDELENFDDELDSGISISLDHVMLARRIRQ